MPNKKLNDFFNLTVKFGEPGDMNYGYTATPNFDLTPSPHFEDDYFILYPYG